MKRLMKWLCFCTAFATASVHAQKIYNEAGGLVIMEMENTDSPLSGWDFRARDSTGYPAGQTGSGHLEFMRYGPDGWGTPSSPLVYRFKINKAGTYRLFFRAHKRLNPGDAGDQHNDCFIRMEGDFESGNPDITEAALRTDSKLFGGKEDSWDGRATNMDAPGAHQQSVYYTFKAGEIYTFIVSGRSNQYNLDRIMFSHSDLGSWPNNTIFVGSPESELAGDPIPDAGEDMVVNLPASQVTLNGSAADDGTITSYAWTQVSGPDTAGLSGQTTAHLTASGLIEGVYVFRLTVTDDESNAAFDEATVRVRNPSAPVTGVIEFEAADGFMNGELNGQVDWRAESNWTVNSGGAGSVASGVNNTLAVLDRPIQLAPGETFEFSMDFEFSGTYAVPSSFVYAILAGLKADASAVSLSTGGHEPDVNVQLQPDGKYRLLNNYGVLSGAGSITTGAPDGGDQLRLDYVITMGATAADTFYTARLQNLTDGTDTGTGTVSGYTTSGTAYPGINTDVYNALTGDGAYLFFQRINPANNSSGLNLFQVNTVTLNPSMTNGIRPTADTGANQVINLPASQVTFVGSGADDGTITNYTWIQVSGPDTATLSGQASATLTASGLIEGSYVFRLTVTDNDGLTGSADVGVLVVDPASAGSISVLGDKIIWHKVTLEMNGPDSAEDSTPNPFADYRMDVTFTHSVSGTTYTVPGFFAADGDAANTSAMSGNKWHCHFRPETAGTWNYFVSFRSGDNVAMGTSASGTVLNPYDGVSGSFAVSAVNPATAPDLRAKGRLQYVGKHHLQFAGSGEYFLKFGLDSPENFLSFFEFDNTPQAGNKGNWKQFAAHSAHYNNDGELWQSTKGQNIYGALNYLSGEGANAISMLLYNVNGDGDRVFPYSTHGEMYRFDCSKLGQWEMVFDHAEKKGMYLHFKLSETENDQDHDNGSLGNTRKLYYREMIARFGHHLALNWNISEEISMTAAQRSDALEYFEANDPWQHHRVFHTAPAADKSSWFDPHKGDSELTGVSLQTPEATTTENVFAETKTWVTESAAAGQPWVVACDEQGPGNLGVNAGYDVSRKFVLWNNIMAGGGGCEYYSGGSDLSLDDYTHFDGLLKYSKYAVHDFFYGQQIPFWNMYNKDALLSGETAHCLTDEAGTYVIYLSAGGTTSLDLSGETGTFNVRWFDPRNGGALQNGSITAVSGGSAVDLGNAPSATTSDWAVLVTRATSANTLPGYLAWAGSVGLAGSDVDPSLDLDGDGLTNLEEYLSGHSPTDPGSVFTIESVQTINTDAQELVIEWESMEERVYSVSQSTDLTEGEYEILADDIVYPQNSCTVDVNQATGFIQVDVRLEEGGE